ncbi:MAG: peptidoglycan-associated lipoprotein Pal [Pontibacterium sp.]
MKASNVTKAVALTLSVAWAAGCSTTSTTDAGSEGAADTGASTQGTQVSGGVTSAEIAAQQAAKSLADAAMAAQTVFYFDFDKSVVRQDGFDALEKHAAYLAANRNASVRLEGHADERGTREYNMALGERRANAVARFLQVNGVNASQVEAISYGEEKPAMMGHSDASWSQNRRVELKYVSK